MKNIFLLLILGFSSLTSAGRRTDEQCQVTGCSAEVCVNQSPNEDDGIVTTCEYKSYYECFKISSCVMTKSSGICGWQKTPQFLKCLKEKKAPNSVILRYTGRSAIQLLIKFTNQG